MRHLIRMGVRKLAASPVVRKKSAQAANTAMNEVRQIARAPDRPRAAGRALRRAFNKLTSDE